MANLSVNKLADRLVDEIVKNPNYYGVKVEEASNGARVVDASAGTYETGRLVGEICMGGLGSVQLTMTPLGGVMLPSVVVTTSHPVVSCLGSQYAGWSIKVKKQVGEKTKTKFYMCSGPARALARVEKKLYEELGYADEEPGTAVAVLECDSTPDVEALDKVATKCGLDPSKLTAVWAPTASVVGSVQIAARVVETGIHKLHELHFNLGYLKNGMGTATIAPIDRKTAMGRTNDAIIYCGRTYYTVDVPKDEEEETFKKLQEAPSNKSRSYGKPFFEEFTANDFDFYKIDPGLFAPAVLTVNNLRTGRVVTVGEVNEPVLLRSYGMA
ncbi:MAG: methenyltetrahydromethanopterin cyclohydrolase [Promethearchaeota archaeon]